MPLSTPVTITAPPTEGWSTISSYDGSNNFEYSGYARSKQSILYTFPGATISAAATAVITATAHGLQAGNAVTIAGGTGDWAGINGTRLITVIDANTFSVAVNSSGYSGTFAGTVSTFAPRTNAACWSIQRSFYINTNYLSRSTWACDPNGTGGTPAPIFAWDSRTTYAYA